MTTPSIKAIVFDVGNTLRAVPKTARTNWRSFSALQSFLGLDGNVVTFVDTLHRREKKYRHWAKRTLIELSEAELWAQYLLPDYPQDFVRANAIKLNQMWRDARVKRLLPDAVETVKALASRGYALAIVSNTTSSVEVPQLLADNGLAALFGCVILSTTFGRRKPHPSLFLSAADQIGVPPERCAYVGDDPSRDLVGARQAGYGQVVLLHADGYRQSEFNSDENSQPDFITEMRPDHRINRLEQLLGIFPQHRAPQPFAALPAAFYDAALSTMWGVDQPIPFDETFCAARQIGVARFELNHKVSNDLYRQWDHDRYYISTVHDPCPADYSSDALKERDLMISSLDESKRCQSVEMLKRTIDLAVSHGARSVVVHAGMIQGDRSRDQCLRAWYQQGLRATAEYQRALAEIKADRAQRVPPYLEQVMKSLEEIASYAAGSGIWVGLENRYRYYDIPLPDEMDLMLQSFTGEWLGFQYDIGHAQSLDELGMVDHFEWLERFASRMVGVHLHDVIGIVDHQVPGVGQVDFRRIARYLPIHAQRTLEIGPQAGLAELATGLKVLADAGCIEKFVETA